MSDDHRGAGGDSTGPARHRPRGWARHVAGLLSPRAVFAGRIALERDAGVRLRRLVAASTEGARERLRPARSRMRALVASPGGRLSWRAVPAPPPPGPQAAVVHRPGQGVVVPFQINCGSCPPCRWGRTGNCANVPPISMYGFGVGGGHWGGALSDQLTVPYADAMLVPLSDAVDPVAAASVADNVCDGYRHVAPYLPEMLQRDPDAEVLVVAGVTRRPVFSPSVALYAGLVARSLGARRVHLADVRPQVRAHADRLGLLPIHPAELRRRRAVPLVVDASAAPRGLMLALSNTAPDGVCSSAGTLHASARLPVGLMYGRNVSFHIARTHVRMLIPQVLELVSDGRLHPEAVTTTVAPMDDAPSVLHDHVIGDGTKTILTT